MDGFSAMRENSDNAQWNHGAWAQPQGLAAVVPGENGMVAEEEK